MALPRASLQFLKDLAAHNDKDWFAANRDRCERDLVAPAKALVARLCEEIARPFPYVIGSTAGAGGSLTRLHRDVRFSKDKRPFHSHIGMHFWHRDGRKMEAPGFFLRIDPQEILIGTGLHQPEPDVLNRVRQAIDSEQRAWARASRDKAFLRTWGGLEGRSLKRVPPPWPADHAFADDLRRQDFTAFRRLPAGDVTKPGFVAATGRAWEASKPLMTFLCKAMNLKC